MFRTGGDQANIGRREASSLIPPSAHPNNGRASDLGADELAAWHLLCSVRGLGPRAAAAVHVSGLTPTELIEEPKLFPLRGKRAQQIVTELKSLTHVEKASAHRFAMTQLQRAKELNTTIISYNDSSYPLSVWNSNNPIPILWVRGNHSILRAKKTVACVGSRRITATYSRLHADFVDVAVQEGFTITSGFAMGADSVGHRRALEKDGFTICVMPCGVDLVFPPENRELWRKLLDSDRAVFLSEFALGRRAESLTLRKRNKLIVATAQGILVSQTSISGGAMNAFRFALEQRKPLATFEPDGTNRTSGNGEIIEGAKGRASVLPTTSVPESYRRWLRGLCCST